MERSTRFDILRQAPTEPSIEASPAKSHPSPNTRPRPRPRRHGIRARSDGQRKWLQFANLAPLESYEDFHNIYAYSRLKLAFPWAQIFRAGMIVFSPDRTDEGHLASQMHLSHPDNSRPINNDRPCPQLLVVQQRGGTIIRDGAKRKLPSYMGLPKGSADASDSSAFHTAIRELREETGIDIDRDASATVSPVVFVIIREEVREVSIYFAVLLKSRPDVVVCAEEIIGHQWVSADQITEIKEISIPTGMLFRAMGEMDMRLH